MKFLCKVNFKKVAIFFLINTVIGMVVSPLRLQVWQHNFGVYLVIAHIVGIAAGCMWLFLTRCIKTRNNYVKQPIVFIATIAASICGLFLSVKVNAYFFSVDMTFVKSFNAQFVMPTVVITLLYLCVIVFLQTVRHRNKHSESDCSSSVFMASHKKKETVSSFLVKKDDVQLEICHENIVYVSSNGRNSVLHTSGEDYLIRKQIGDIDEILPKSLFIRIHKRFIVNRKYLGKLQYYKGGRYNLYLSDNDENILPVGKLYTTAVKVFVRS